MFMLKPVGRMLRIMVLDEVMPDVAVNSTLSEAGLAIFALALCTCVPS